MQTENKQRGVRDGQIVLQSLSFLIQYSSGILQKFQVKKKRHLS